MNIVLLEPEEITTDGAASIEGARARHMIDVLRVAAGSTVRIGVIDGAVGTARIEAVTDGRVELSCSLGEIPARPRVDLLLALPRPKVVGRLYGALAQLGIGRLMLTNAERVERFYFDAHQLEPAYMRGQMIEGLAQAKDTRLPAMSVHRSLRALIEDELDVLAPREETLRVLADPGAHASMRDACAGLSAHQRVLIAIGPEGGWNDFERDLLTAHAFGTIAMGSRTLRTDVATVSLLALAHDALR